MPAEADGSVFVARQHELARLDTLLDAALAGQNQVAFVTGEAGQGKTALLQAFAKHALQAQPDLIVVGGNCNLSRQGSRRRRLITCVRQENEPCDCLLTRKQLPISPRR